MHANNELCAFFDQSEVKLDCIVCYAVFYCVRQEDIQTIFTIFRGSDTNCLYCSLMLLTDNGYKIFTFCIFVLSIVVTD